MKDITHLRRRSNTTVEVYEPVNTLNVNKKVFLQNNHNKQQFIAVLSDCLEKAGYHTVHATGDAHLLIAQSAVFAVVQRENVVVAALTPTY